MGNARQVAVCDADWLRSHPIEWRLTDCCPFFIIISCFAVSLFNTTDRDREEERKRASHSYESPLCLGESVKLQSVAKWGTIKNSIARHEEHLIALALE